MKAGRELDILVAEKVMRREVEGGFFIIGEDSFRYASKAFPVPAYSTDIAAAWEVVEKFGDVARLERRYTPARWWCELGCAGGSSEAIGETPAHAICLAALKAVGAL